MQFPVISTLPADVIRKMYTISAVFPTSPIIAAARCAGVQTPLAR
jgi:energy-converting hydrogenase Eha subunit A